jgi:hypothetical protein
MRLASPKGTAKTLSRNFIKGSKIDRNVGYWPPEASCVLVCVSFACGIFGRQLKIRRETWIPSTGRYYNQVRLTDKIAREFKDSESQPHSAQQPASCPLFLVVQLQSLENEEPGESKRDKKEEAEQVDQELFVGIEINHAAASATRFGRCVLSVI